MLMSLIKRLFHGSAHSATTAPDCRELSRPNSEESYAEIMERARQSFASGNYAQALDVCRQLVELDPADPQAWLQLGRTLNKKRDYAAARKALDTADSLEPEIAAVYYERGIALEQSRKFKLALGDFEHVLTLKPASVSALIKQGSMHYELGDLDRALECTERAVAIEPDNLVANQNLGLRLRDLGRYVEAERVLRRAIDLYSDNTITMCYLTLVLLEVGRFKEARRWIDRVLAIDPRNNEAYWNLALILLLEGNFTDGWRHYESRRFRNDVVPRPYRFPEWDGLPMPRGTLLIYAEQGLGDDIIFASCFTDVMRRVGQVIIECEPRLEKLFRRSFPAAIVYGSKADPEPQWLAQGGDVTAQIPAGSLPRYVRAELQDFPSHNGYLRADESRITYWRARLDELGAGLKVGLAWTGGVLKTRRRLRSLAATDLIPLLKSTDTHFVSLQYEDSSDDLALLRDSHHLTVHHWQQAIDDYDETAALVSALDLVITVQTTAVDLSAALGRPVWVLVAASPEWRYMASGATIPWYPSVRLFRQRRDEDWQPVISTVTAELAQLPRS